MQYRGYTLVWSENYCFDDRLLIIFRSLQKKASNAFEECSLTTQGSGTQWNINHVAVLITEKNFGQIR